MTRAPLNCASWERNCCLTCMEVRRPIRDGDKCERGKEEWNLETNTELQDQGCHGPPPEQQNVTAVSAQHCTATTIPCNCCLNCYAEQSHKDNIRSSAIGKQLKQKKSYLQAQLHLPILGLTWGSSTTSLLLISPGLAEASYFFVIVQLISLLLISPGLCVHFNMAYS